MIVAVPVSVVSTVRAPSAVAVLRLAVNVSVSSTIPSTVIGTDTVCGVVSFAANDACNAVDV